MKKIIIAAAVGTLILAAGVPPVCSQDGYTFITTEKGPQICIGEWIPPRDVGLAGTCRGQMMGLSQMTALSSRETVDRLDELITVLSEIDQKLDISNTQMDQLIEATNNTQKAIDRQVQQSGEFLRETITERFRGLPKEILANDAFREEIDKLREEILEDIEKRYPAKTPAPAGK